MTNTNADVVKPVADESLVRERAETFTFFTKATTFAVATVVAVLALLAIFLL